MTAPAPLPIFLFYLVNEKGESYYIDNNGNLRLSGLPSPVEYSPDGWEDLSIGWERNLYKFGLIRNFSVSLGFYGDGGLILEKLYNRTNVDEKVWLLVQRLELEVTVDDFALTHKFYYKGEIDLSTYRKIRRKVLVNIMEGGRSKDIKANEGTTFNIPVSDDPEAIRVKMDGVELQENARFAVVGPVTNTLVTLLHTAPIAFLNKEGTSFGVAFFSQDVESIGVLNTYVAGSDNHFLMNESGSPIDFNLSGPIVFTCTKNDIAATIRFELVKASDGIPLVIWNLQDQGVPMTVGNTFTANIDQDITLNNTDKLFLMARFFGLFPGGAVEVAVEYLDTSRLALSFNSRYKTTYIKALKAKTAFKRLVGKVSGSEDYAVSTLLDGSTLCHTSGDAMRGIAGSYIKTTFRQFTDDMIVRKCAGLGVEGQNIVLEARPYWLNDDVIVDLGEVKDLEVSPATDIMFNALKMGYNDQNIEDINGRLAFNMLYQFSTPVKRIAKSLELLCPYPTDPFYIEVIRINFDGKVTTDSSTDNDTIVLNVDLDNPQTDAEGTYYNLKRAAYTSVEGVPNPDSLFNIEELTPARILNNWIDYLRGCLDGFEGGILQFESASKNENFATFGGPGGDFVEKASKRIGLVGTPYFTNDKLTFTARGPVSLIKTLASTPRACFRFTYNGNIFKGYLLKGSIKSKTGQEQSFALLSHIDNDLTVLENG